MPVGSSSKASDRIIWIFEEEKVDQSASGRSKTVEIELFDYLDKNAYINKLLDMIWPHFLFTVLLDSTLFIAYHMS